MVTPKLAEQQIAPESNFKLETRALGFQLVATRIIPKNEFILAVYYSLADSQTMHTFQIDDNKHVICPVVERINHSCDPNCGLIVDTNNGVLKIVSMKHIGINEALTIDYCTFEKSIKYMPKQCLCGSKYCRGSIGGFSDLSMKDRKWYEPFIPTYIRRNYSIADKSLSFSQSIKDSTIAYDPVADRITSRIPLFVNDKERLSSYILNALMLGKSVKATRISIRLIIPKPFHKLAIEYVHDKDFKAEAEISLAGDFSDYTLVYIGRNESNRASTKYILCEQDKLLAKILSGNRLSPYEIEYRLNTKPYKVELLRDKISAADRSSILKMHQESLHRYQRHDFNQKVDIMLSSPQTYTAAVVRGLKDNRIYAFGNTEHTGVALSNNRVLRLAEFDNCVKSQTKDAPGGLAIHLRLSLALDAFSRGANLCFAESRAASGGINGASRRFGMRYCGTLAQHIVIAGPGDIAVDTERQYEDFNVWSITPQLMGRESSSGLTRQ